MKPVGTVQIMGSFKGVVALGCLLDTDAQHVKVGDKLYALRYNTELVAALREAATVISNIPDDVAEAMQVRHFLSDELEGFALIVEDCTDAQKNDNRSG